VSSPLRPGYGVAAMDSAHATHVSVTVNGEPRAVRVDNRMSVLDLLRERLGLTGPKKGCDHGQCGACTVLADGRRVNACLALAVAYDGASIQTVEGLAGPEGLHPLQRAFLRHDAFQCGYCTPGQLCSAVGMLTEPGPSAVTADLTVDPPLTPGEIRERMSGNLCRCGAYVNIVKAISSETPPGSGAADPLSAISLGDTAPYPPARRLGGEAAP
jgi:xanthine dehydrogenase YagT iron-sulfur-binding subunit